MKYLDLVNFYQKIESTTKRLEMTSYLVDLIEKTPVDVIDKVIYMTEGKLYPDFVGIEIGLAEKMAYRALSKATGISSDSLEQEIRKKGDIGSIAENLLKTKKQKTLFSKDLTIEDVYYSLDKIAKTTGHGSHDTKLRTLSGLLLDANPIEAKYILRIVTGKMRLGIADMTIMDALSRLYKVNREEIERVYNITSDLGDIAKTLKSGKGKDLNQYSAKVGRPIRMMLAQRLDNAKDIIEKIGKAICEYKYDGERLQIHKNEKGIKLFSRNLENITEQYPDIINYCRKNINVNNVIMEGECVAVDTNTGDLLPFQQLMRRRRKYDIEEKAEEFPAHVYLFDILMKEGKDIMNKGLTERRDILKNSITETSGFKLSHSLVTNNIKEIESFFELAIEDGCEGLILKGENSTYQAGARGWNWIKLKRSYQSKMIEPIDVVIVGAFMGRGRRSGTYGALLVSVYDSEKDTFPTISKVGSGFTDEELKELPEILSSYKLDKKHPRVDSHLKADIWFTPGIVIETIGDELTLSPIHKCGFGIRENAGIAIRFPRFTHNFRYDKNSEDATTVEEVINMYRSQLKTIDTGKMA